MSLTQVGSTVYASISDLPESQSISDGDQILIQTTDGTMLVDYANIAIDLDHTTFGDTYATMVEFMNTAESFVTEVSEAYDDLTTQVATMDATVTDLNCWIEAIKLTITLMCTGTTTTANLTTMKTNLSTTAQTYYDELFDAIEQNNGDGFSFATNYLFNQG